MTKHYSIDYHDYVFKDGKFVGKFEQMYKYSSEIPWHQDKTAYSASSDKGISILKQFKYDTVCEIACGLGYFSNRLHEELSSKKGKPRVTGIDISQTAIQKAKGMFPEVDFIKSDVIKERILPGLHFDLVVVKDSLFYVCHRLKQFLDNVIDLVNKDGFLYVSQCFPQVDKWVGQEMIDTPETLKGMLLQYTEDVYSCIEWDRKVNNKPCSHFLGKKTKS